MSILGRLITATGFRSVTLVLPCVTAVLFVLWCSPARGEMIDGIVAVVDDKVIMHSDLVKKMQEIGAQGYDPSVARQVLQIMVEDVIVDKVYRGMGLPKIDIGHAEEVAKGMNIDIVSAQSVIKRNSLMEIMVKSRIVVTESMIKDYYDSHEAYSGLESLHLKQILIKKDAEKATKAIEDLRKAVPMDEVAKAYSDLTAGDTPDIGWIPIKDLANEARTPLANGKPGDIVGPVTVGENILIYQIMERGVSGGKPLDEARDEITEALQEKFRNEAFEHWLKMIMGDHYIGIYM
jgi:parvulin-like peptidyl-prolyl isomerase